MNDINCQYGFIENYWYSSVYANYSYYRWYVNFDNGDVYYYDIGSKKYVRCITGRKGA